MQQSQPRYVMGNPVFMGATDDSTESWQGELSTDTGYVVAMTHNQATVWRYTQGHTVNDSTKPLLINLPHPSSSPRNPLPLGLIISTSAEPGFLVVMPASGNVTYWESLSSAATIARHRQKQQGTHGIVSGMTSGEVICKVTEGEPHGFLLTFNTGRVAHMAVSDPQGHPAISVEYLRGSAASTGGLLGSLRGVFSSGGWKRDIAAIRAGNSWQRGQRCAVVATTKGVFQVWDLNWNGTNSFMFEVDATEDLIKSLQGGGAIPSDQVDHPMSEIQGDFEVLDFTFLPVQSTGNELARSTQKGSCRLMVLTAFKGAHSSRFALVGLNLTAGALVVDVVHPISCYTDSVSRESGFKSQVLIPETAQIAFVVFESSIILVSLVQIEDSPSSQLQIESQAFPDPFQDAIDFRKDKGYRVVGCAAELPDRSQKGSSCLVMVSNFGIIRVVALPVKEGQSAFDRAAVTAQTKIEQAVFYGNLPQNLLDFSGRREIAFGEPEIEEAALAVSESIMNSTSAYIPALAASMDQQLQRRSTALADLMKHLKDTKRPVTRPVRWLLLWDAEKMAACHALWRWYNTAIATKREDEQNLLYETVFMLHERYKTENDPTNYETDRVRHWFIHDAWRLEYLIPMAHVAVEELYNHSVEIEETQDAATQARLLGEANDIQLSTLETAFEFRQKNAKLYGVEGEHMVDGVLRSGYEELPEIWTSTHHIVAKIRLLVDLSREMAIRHDDDEDESMAKLIEKLIIDNPRLVQLCCQTHIERFRWLKTQDRPDSKEDSWRLQKDHFEIRKIMFVKLSEIGLGREGIKLAEKYREMGALADIIHYALEEETQHSTQPGIPDSERQEASQITQLLRKQIHSYFDRFGHAWADAYFTKQINLGYSIEVLNDTASYKEHLTRFLRSHPEYSKLSWVSEVHSEHNYAIAAKNLETAETQETSLWGKKIALCMSKLAILAAKATKQASDESVDNLIHKTDKSIAIFTAQEQFYNYIRPAFMNAIDSDAENLLTIDKYCKRFVQDKPTLGEVLKHNMSKLIARKALDPHELADILTLMDEEGLYPDDQCFADGRFFTALRVLRDASIIEGERSRNDLDEKIIWRRCMNVDDWEAINRTELKDDTQVEVETGSTALFKTLKEWYKFGTLATSYQPSSFRSLIFCWFELDLLGSTPPPPPSSLLGAGTTVESLQSSIRYAQTPEDALALLANDLASEDAILQKHIKKGRLEIWWKGVADAAQKSLRDEGDRQGEETRRRKSDEKGFWNAISKRDSEALKGRIDEEGKEKSSKWRKGEIIMDKQRETSAEGQRKVNGEGQREVNGDIDVEMKMD